MNPGSYATRISFEDAQRMILERALPGTTCIDLPVAEADGYVLVDDIVSDIDMPRFNRAAMDGFAFRHADAAERDVFRVAATIAAGEQTQVPLEPGDCVRIMTGAPLPADADTVIPVEETGPADASADTVEPQRVRFHNRLTRGMHVAALGEDIRRGAVALRAGQLLRHQEIAILAAVGHQRVPVHDKPTIAFAATGEELLEPGAPLPPAKIYNSNAYSLWSQILHAHAKPHYLGVVSDTRDELRATLAAGLEEDVLLLSGGVSMGTFDLVPEVLQELGVEIVFHRLLLKPARPTLFGIRDRTMVFGLPGNPVATIYAFDQFVMPAIRVFCHHPRPQANRYRGELTEEVRAVSGRLLLLPCHCEWMHDRFLLTPIKTHGSADVFSIQGANTIALIPAGSRELKRGDTVQFRRLYED